MPPDDDPPNDPDEGPVLSPEDLDITEDDNVTEIDDDRYVISPSGTDPVPTEPTPDPSATPDDPSSADLTEDEVHGWLADKFHRAEAVYGFDVTAKFDSDVHQHTVLTNDVVTNFENLLRWYARHAGGETPVEEVLGLLLVEADTAVQYPPAALEATIAALDLDRTDTIGDLLDRLEDGNFRFPP